VTTSRATRSPACEQEIAGGAALVAEPGIARDELGAVLGEQLRHRREVARAHSRVERPHVLVEQLAIGHGVMRRRSA
jgi:hypothetical protein